MAYADQMPRVRQMIEEGLGDDQIIAETGVPQNKVYEVRRVLEQTGVHPTDQGEKAS